MDISIVLMFWLTSALHTHAQEPRAHITTSPQSINAQQAFAAWQRTPQGQLGTRYQQHLQQHSNLPLSLFELSYNRHPPIANCPYQMFAIPPKAQWNNLIPAINILNQFKKQKLIEKFTIISVYRDPAANRCIQGSARSKHLSHHAIDFQTPPDRANQLISTNQRLCQFWQQHGKSLHLGLGVYGLNRFHIDAAGYRTWGIDYRRASSPCLLTNQTRQTH